MRKYCPLHACSAVNDEQIDQSTSNAFRLLLLRQLVMSEQQTAEASTVQ
jgi:hypothetical protein